MRTWLFTWNPSRWAWDSRYDGFLEMKNQIAQTGVSYRTWSCGNNKSIKKGDRIFLIRLGVAPKGIIASGYAASNVFEGPHWDVEKDSQGKKCRRIFIEFDNIQDASNESIISIDELLDISSTYKWTSQTSGIEIPNHIAESIERLWKRTI
jgi:lambda repressor-like predicted transcriptional regulator